MQARAILAAGSLISGTDRFSFRESMTLEEFADQLGIDLETARDWLRRGRIVESRPGIWRLAVTRDEADRQPRPGTRPFAGDWIDQGGTTKRRDS